VVQIWSVEPSPLGDEGFLFLTANSQPSLTKPSAAPLILRDMETTDTTPTPSSRDAGLRLRRRLTVGSAAAASVATAFFAVVGALTIPGTAAASATSTAATNAASSTSSSAASTTATSAAATTVTQAPANATTHAVSGGSG
jgi:hypothetical protein